MRNVAKIGEALDAYKKSKTWAVSLQHQLDPYHYLVEIFKRLPYCNNIGDFEALLPWNIQLPAVGILKTA